VTRIDDIKARLAAATPGPWRYWTNGFDRYVIGNEDPKTGTFESIIGGEPHEGAIDENDPNCTLIANAPADLAYLLRVAEAARSVFAALDEHGLSRTIVPMMALRIALEHGDGIAE
jgi:hypothetical protein